MRLHVHHSTSYTFDGESAHALSRMIMRVRLWPSVFDGQEVEDWSVSVNGERIDQTRASRSSFGDMTALWTSAASLPEVRIEATGIVETVERVGVVKNLPVNPVPAVFLRQTPLTKSNETIRSLADHVAHMAPLSSIHALLERIVETPFPDENQDTDRATEQTHALISAARHLRHPARFVTGYVFDTQTQSALLHSWAEVYIQSIGWIGFDPVHGLCPTEAYVRLGCGLDAQDAQLVKLLTFDRQDGTPSISVVIEQSATPSMGIQTQQ